MVGIRIRGWVVVLALLSATSSALAQSGSDSWVASSSKANARAENLAPSAVVPLGPWPVSAKSFAPEALAMDQMGRLFALDRSRGRIFRFSREGGMEPFGVGEQGGARFANLRRIFARFGPDLFAIDPVGSTLYRFDLNGRLRSSIVYVESDFDNELGFVDAVDFGLNKAGELLVLDRAGGRLLLLDRFGEFVTDYGKGATGSARLEAPTRMDQDEEGEIYVLDPAGSWVRRFSRQGEPRKPWRFDQDLPETVSPGEHLAVTSWGHVVVAARNASWVRVFAPDGERLIHADVGEPDQSEVTDMVAASDSLLHLARPDAGQILRLRLIYPEHETKRGR